MHPETNQEQTKKGLSSNTKFGLGVAGLIIGVLFILWLIIGMFIVTSQELGVKSTWGKIKAEPVKEGLHFAVPIMQKVKKIDMRERKTTINTSTVSKEGLGFDIVITVRYRVKDAINLVKNLQTPLHELINTYANATIDDVSSGKDKNELYSDTGRVEIVKAVKTKLNTELYGYAIIEQVILEDIDLPDSITKAIEAQQAALELIKEEENLKLVETIKAEKRVIEARGIADANKIIQSSLTQAYLQYEAIQKLNPGAEKIFIPANGVVPMIDLGR